MALRDKLRLIRYEEHWSQEEAARECGLSYAWWRAHECGSRTNPTLNALVKVASRVRKSIDWLVDYHPDWRRIFNKNCPTRFSNRAATS